MFFATSIPNVVVFISNPPLYLVNEWLFLVEIPLILPHPRLFEKRAGSIPLLHSGCPSRFVDLGIRDPVDRTAPGERGRFCEKRGSGAPLSSGERERDGR